MHIQQACQILQIHPNDPDLGGSAHRSFRKLSKEYHPDKREDNDDTKFKEINNAYSVVTEFLKNPWSGEPHVNVGPMGFTINIDGLNITPQAGQVVERRVDANGNVEIIIRNY